MRRWATTYIGVVRITLPSGTPAEIEPVTGATRGLVVFPDIFGLRPLFDDLVHRFASEWGFTTVALDPFPGLDPSTPVEERFTLMGGLDDAAKLRDIGEAADATGCPSVVMIGFCMGGMYCFKAASLRRFHRIASFYGMIRVPEGWRGAGQGEPLSHLERGDASSVLAVIGGRDPYTPEPDVVELEALGVNVVRYPDAEHGFCHDANRPAHRVEDAADAFARAGVWLKG